jgi:hypothetical protein
MMTIRMNKAATIMDITITITISKEAPQTITTRNIHNNNIITCSSFIKRRDQSYKC